jgi:hypothetical protein
MRLYGVKGLRRDVPAGGGELPEAAHHRLLLQGGNGSGQTTVLDAIRLLWQFFGEWLDRGAGKAPPARHIRSFLAAADCAAVEIVGFPAGGQRLWIGMAAANAWTDLKRQHPGAAFAGAVRYGRSATDARTELPAAGWAELRARSMVGSAPLPNVVYIPPDNRTLRAPRADRRPASPLLDLTALNWCAVFDPARSLDKLLLTVKALRPEAFDECLRLVNLAIGHGGKRITGFNEEGRLEVEGETELGTMFRHPVEQLSSGERQMLLLTAYAVALLRPGGILIIDEPDLHIHIAMVTQLLQTLEFVVREREGQLIVASHSERVWDFFSREDERIELSPWRGAKP